MQTFIIDVPVPSMGATASELTVISLKVQPGAQVKKGDRLAELESEKSTFDYEAPCDGTIRAFPVKAGDVLTAGQLFCQIETSDESQRHLAVSSAAAPVAAHVVPKAPVVAALIWTPRATKLAQEAGLDPTKVTDIEATGPGKRVSGDDVVAYLAKRKS